MAYRKTEAGRTKDLGARKAYSAKKAYSPKMAQGEKKAYSPKKEQGERKPYSPKKESGEKKAYSPKKESAVRKPPAQKKAPERPLKKEYPGGSNDQRDDGLQLEGRNAVLEALKAGNPLDSILIKKGENEGTARLIIALAKEAGVTVKEMTKEKLDSISVTGKHQGVIAKQSAHAYATLDDIFAKAAARSQKPFILVLDGITDPHNLGAIIRSAECSGAHGVIIPKRRASGLTAVAAKTSAGAVEHVPVCRVVNIAAVIQELKKRGCWVVAAEMAGENYYNSKADLTGALALVIGGEGEGISRLARENCDFAVKIPMLGKIDALNASVAAGILMYEVVRRRLGASLENRA